VIVLSVIGVAAPAPPPDGSARRRTLNVAMSLIVGRVGRWRGGGDDR
jgi:hypothetical protein